MCSALVSVVGVGPSKLLHMRTTGLWKDRCGTYRACIVIGVAGGGGSPPKRCCGAAVAPCVRLAHSMRLPNCWCEAMLRRHGDCQGVCSTCSPSYFVRVCVPPVGRPTWSHSGAHSRFGFQARSRQRAPGLSASMVADDQGIVPFVGEIDLADPPTPRAKSPAATTAEAVRRPHKPDAIMGWGCRR